MFKTVAPGKENFAPEFQETTVKALGKSVSIEESHPDEPEHPPHCFDDDDDDEFSEGLTARQKTALGFIWYEFVYKSSVTRRLDYFPILTHLHGIQNLQIFDNY